MRVSTLFAVGSIVTGASASLFGTIDLQAILDGADLSDTNNYGSPQPPWVHGANPGWYYGNNPHLFPGIPCLNGVRTSICSFYACLIILLRSSCAKSWNTSLTYSIARRRPHPSPNLPTAPVQLPRRRLLPLLHPHLPPMAIPRLSAI